MIKDLFLSFLFIILLFELYLNFIISIIFLSFIGLDADKLKVSLIFFFFFNNFYYES